MRFLLCAALLCLVSELSLAAETAEPNTLTAREVADGWLLMFDGETTFGWKIKGPADVANGVLTLGAVSASGITAASLPARIANAKLSWEQRTDPDGKWEAKSAEGPLGDPMFLLRDARIHLRNIKLKPLGLVSIFNGKDLTGWKVNPGEKYKSVFSVNGRGELNVKNGPGDLQSEGLWGDFVLQLECISNGEHLNSGIFFRCRPNEYQQGYEAQIRNQFHEQADQKYTLEVYDPQTHELKEKKPALYTAVDYGTGAIYRRQPARKQMSRDKEWFAMTIVAQGRHFAVWVNGVQVTDWTDNRPLKDNARNGCRLDKGPISIQGHDPTTDLSFRNLRIAELPKTGK